MCIMIIYLFISDVKKKAPAIFERAVIKEAGVADYLMTITSFFVGKIKRKQKPLRLQKGPHLRKKNGKKGRRGNVGNLNYNYRPFVLVNFRTFRKHLSCCS